MSSILNLNFDFMKHRRIALTISLILVIEIGRAHV